MNNIQKVDNYLILLDLNPDTKIVEGDWYLEHTQVKPDRFELYQRTFEDESIENSFKVIAFLPLTPEAKPLEGPPLLLPIKSEEKGVSLDLVNDAFDKTSFPSVGRNCFFEGAKFGYKANQSDKKYSEEDMIKCVEFCQTEMQSYGYIGANKYTSFLESLTTTKYPVSFHITMEEFTDYHNGDKENWTVVKQPKIVNGVLQGKYVY